MTAVCSLSAYPIKKYQTVCEGQLSNVFFSDVQAITQVLGKDHLFQTENDHCNEAQNRK